MRKIAFIATAFWALVSARQSTAQELIHHCGADELYKQQITKDPDIKRRALAFDAYARGTAPSRAELISSSARAASKDSFTLADTLLVPVVIHVLYNSDEENISDVQIAHQLDIINRDYERLNADTIQTPVPFRALAGRMRIVFSLARVDPNGDSTSGVIRKYTNKQAFNALAEEIKYPSQGGDTSWPCTRYYNVWVGNLSDSYLGLAQFPFVNNPATDGVTIHYKAFGDIGTASKPYNLGRTLTHETGHWLNLFHIWGDTECGDDNVADTPPQYGEHTESDRDPCPAFPSTSACPGNGPNGDMFMNYMDYTKDVCMNMFSQGQTERMLAAVNYYPDRDSLFHNSFKVTSKSRLAAAGSTHSISLYPNPNQGAFKISYQLGSAQSVKFFVYDIFGKEIYRSTVTLDASGVYSINDMQLSKGMYILRSETASKVYVNKLIVE